MMTPPTPRMMTTSRLHTILCGPLHVCSRRPRNLSLLCALSSYKTSSCIGTCPLLIRRMTIHPPLLTLTTGAFLTSLCLQRSGRVSRSLSSVWSVAGHGSVKKCNGRCSLVSTSYCPSLPRGEGKLSSFAPVRTQFIVGFSADDVLDNYAHLRRSELIEECLAHP
ncbi:hypothetical protein EXIGLDRAFT_444133 [Exidia glandulosa HHB12029]|uniref:Uncharacterized protein n=1 Tax=Exidia glandulosa HHB12029 TaxID=1314781 RepID=A0A165B6J7_EXIGL|nr:hypothetical protein EXIGLDRAFT_444133 [Exidia glandulosa HHB12029]